MSRTDSIMSTVGYGGAGTSILASLTLNDWGVLIGICIAVTTGIIHTVYYWRKDRREQQLCELQVEAIKEGRAQGRRKDDQD